jgi:VWFA-related protein
MRMPSIFRPAAPLLLALAVTLPAAAQGGAPAQPPSPAPAPAAPAAGTPAARAAAPAAGQESPLSIFGEQIEVRVVNVEVVVTDRGGNRVPDLQPRDFRLRVDGKTVPIEYFTEVRGGQAIAAAPGAAEAPPLPGLPSLAPGSPVGTSYLVFVDDYFSVPARRDEVLRALKKNLTRLGPEDRMAIVAYDGRHLHLRSSWSSSQRDLGRAIEQEIGIPSRGLERLAELTSYDSTRRLGVGPPLVGDGSFPLRGAFATELTLPERAYAEQLASQEKRVVDAAVSTLRGFASPPGRKVMLLLSGGWPFSPADYIVNNPGRPILTRQVPRGEDIMRPLSETANRLGYTLYPVDVPGLQTAAVDASEDGPALPAGIIDMREQENKGTLMFLADATGGRALLNSLRIDALPTVEADTRSYYWLGFTPAWKGNDKSHRIVVDSQRPGLKVRARNNFLDLSRKAEVSMMVESAMLFGYAPGSAPMPVKLGAPVKTGRSEMEVPVTIVVPMDAVTGVHINGKYNYELELRIAALDDHGDRSDMPVIPIRFSSEQEGKGKFFRYEAKLKLRRIKQSVTLAIFDPLSNHILTAEADVKP